MFNEGKQIVKYGFDLGRTMPAAFDNGSWVVCNQYVITQLLQACSALCRVCQYRFRRELSSFFNYLLCGGILTCQAAAPGGQQTDEAPGQLGCAWGLLAGGR